MVFYYSGDGVVPHESLSQSRKILPDMVIHDTVYYTHMCTCNYSASKEVFLISIRIYYHCDLMDVIMWSRYRRHKPQK